MAQVFPSLTEKVICDLVLKGVFRALFKITFENKKKKKPLIRKLEKAVAVSGVCSGVLQENSGKIPGKLPNRKMLQIPGFQGTGKGKPAGNLGSTLPGPRPHLPCGMFFFNRQFQPSRFFSYLRPQIALKDA